jgi:hypothetical protein
MKIIFTIVAVLLYTNSFSQDQLMGEVKKAPIIDAQVYGSVYNPKIYGGCHHDNGVIIRSASPNIFSISNGSVNAVFSIDGNQVIIIKGEDKNFYCYTSLDTAYFSRGDCIKIGDLIGLSSFSPEKKLFEITIMIANEKGNYFNENKLWQIINQLNKIPSIAVCDATVIN